MLTNSWRKSSRSYNNGDCVEARRDATTVQMRDSKDSGGSVLGFHQDRWQEFLEGIALGEFDRR
ncbi:hypothetical protein GCM10023170_002200 [Phytohabitans houttuyneae]|uniref:DUF397 domain-containing protein n=1 Tax=Phytohabitans houttuyneae TaxID=1076126 RepID=A0A6V8K986_9ACTN|nr:DUF397 domain-containing protein [Phytohabitans houttuyneae]GFJ78576.1 hypothetical protein Phou_027560 [Phytohabitans houttuyneae]